MDKEQKESEVIDYKPEIIKIFLAKDIDDMTKTLRLNQLMNDKVHTQTRILTLKLKKENTERLEPIIREFEEGIVKLREAE